MNDPVYDHRCEAPSNMLKTRTKPKFSQSAFNRLVAAEARAKLAETPEGRLCLARVQFALAAEALATAQAQVTAQAAA
ncbi:hypothetical protein [Variovorax sp. JS1663]|uniref:hypothetical protein n=1 Tax=Variovorax sp. JS1663 TaxID=1851577 RepID=UPI001180D201|nr:hypothetical protein [Variovorax sp. JS1663]